MALPDWQVSQVDLSPHSDPKNMPGAAKGLLSADVRGDSDFGNIGGRSIQPECFSALASAALVALHAEPTPHCSFLAMCTNLVSPKLSGSARRSELLKLDSITAP